jgi:hypothetical protein
LKDEPCARSRVFERLASRLAADEPPLAPLVPPPSELAAVDVGLELPEELQAARARAAPTATATTVKRRV